MKILITGGTGFTGSHLVKHVLREGHAAVVLDNQEGIMLGELRELGAEIIIGSVTEPDTLRKAVASCDAVYHLAAAFRKINVPKSEYDGTNITAMSSLLEICRDAGVKKIVYCSTQGVHGNIESLARKPPVPGNEDSPIKPEDYYQLTKYEGEKVAHTFMEQGMDITILRPTALYGPGDPGRFLMLYRQVKKGWFPFFGDGSAFYHPVHVGNFCDAFTLSLHAPASKGRTYIIADGEYFHIREIVAKIAEIMGVKCRFVRLPFYPMYWLSFIIAGLWKILPTAGDPPLFPRRVDWYRQNRGFDISRAQTELNYKPAVDLDEGLKLAYDWYKKNNYL
jgi:nucleoside-diphosphate-sugar epimerase